MKRNARKWLSRLITFALVLGLIPALGLTTLADGGDVTTVTTEADLRSALSAAGTATVRLGADITTSDVLTVKDTKTLDLNGYGIKANSTDEKIFSVISVIGLSATLNLTDSGTTTHYYYLDESGLAHVAESAEDPNYVNAKADYKSFFTGGYLTGGSGTDYGGYYIGGGVYVNNGTFNMEGGTILGNALGDGGGVCVLGRGSFTMNGGAILGNTANDYGGGGVFLYNPGSPIGPKFIMNGGKINYNSAPTSGTTPEQQAIDVVSGGGVYNFAGTFIMNGGEIRGNWAFTGGGGVENYYGGSFTMTGGTIEQNTASKYGGGVENCYGSTFNMEGGTIQQNEVYHIHHVRRHDRAKRGGQEKRRRGKQRLQHVQPVRGSGNQQKHGEARRRRLERRRVHHVRRHGRAKHGGHQRRRRLEHRRHVYHVRRHDRAKHGEQRRRRVHVQWRDGDLRRRARHGQQK